MKKNIVLGVTGSIAAHKAADLASLLTKAKCDVRVVMTADAQRFITPLPFKTLTRNPVVTDPLRRGGRLATDAHPTGGRGGFAVDRAGDGECDRETGAWHCR